MNNTNTDSAIIANLKKQLAEAEFSKREVWKAGQFISQEDEKLKELLKQSAKQQENSLAEIKNLRECCDAWLEQSVKIAELTELHGSHKWGKCPGDTEISVKNLQKEIEELEKENEKLKQEVGQGKTFYQEVMRGQQAEMDKEHIRYLEKVQEVGDLKAEIEGLKEVIEVDSGCQENASLRKENEELKQELAEMRQFHECRLVIS
jgi:regulator of replication initiation timing